MPWTVVRCALAFMIGLMVMLATGRAYPADLKTPKLHRKAPALPDWCSKLGGTPQWCARASQGTVNVRQNAIVPTPCAKGGTCEPPKGYYVFIK